MNLVCGLRLFVTLNFLCAISLSHCPSPFLIKSWHLSHRVMKVRRLQSAVSGGRGPDTRHTYAGERDIWQFIALINSLSKRRKLIGLFMQMQVGTERRWWHMDQSTPSLWTGGRPEAQLGLPGLRSSIGRLMHPEVLHCSGRIITYSSGVCSELF